jgi:hypothetical protein
MSALERQAGGDGMGARLLARARAQLPAGASSSSLPALARRAPEFWSGAGCSALGHGAGQPLLEGCPQHIMRLMGGLASSAPSRLVPCPQALKLG